MNDLFNISIQQALDEVLIIQNNLHFIRADWFYAFIPLFLFLYFSYRTTLNTKNWLGIIDQQLLPFVLSSSANKQRRYPLLLVFIACSLCITALAGPVYKKLPQPVYREQSSLVVLLDLSQSMNATDVKPSRLSRAKLELLDLLKTRKTGQTALVVYAADAFVVTPLTDDNATIANMVPSLETDMMPAQGSNLANALDKTFSLFSQAGIINGNILVITDDIPQRDEMAIKNIVSQGHRLSVFGIGTAEGAPVPLDGGFLQNSEGAIVIPKLYAARLQNYALDGGGLYSSLQADNSDIDKFTSLFQSTNVSMDIDNKELNADVWQEEGHWLLLPVIFIAALWARKGWLAVLLLFVLSFIGSIPQVAYADTTDTQDNYLATENVDTKYIDTKNLWSRPDQKAMKAFNNGDNEKAAENFTHAEWKASALYRNGDYEAAAKTLENTNSSDAYYNRGNALAKLGKFEQAIKAYDKALELNEKNDDASYNREQVKQALKKQQQESQSQQDDQSQDSQQQDNQQQDDQQQNSEQQDGQQQDSPQSDKQSPEQAEENNNDKSEKDQEQQSSSKSDSQEQQQMEQEQLEQRDAKAEAEQQKQEEQQYQQQQKENQDETQQQDNQQQNPDTANKEVEHKDSEEKPLDIEVNPMEASITEDEKATEQWLKRIPDDPGGLLRRKFYYQYKKIPNQSNNNEPW